MWSTPYSGGVFASSPSIGNDSVYIGSGAGKILAYDFLTGNQKWSFSPTEDAIWGSPAISENAIFIQSLAGRIYALNSDTGALLWTYRTSATGNREYSSPAIAGKTIYFGSVDKNLYAFNTQSGSLLWKYSMQGEVSSPIISNHQVIISTSDGKVYAFGKKILNTILNVPYLSQNSSPWGPMEYDHTSLLNAPNQTIDMWGCAITSAAMILNYHGMTQFADGSPMNPENLNDWLKKNNGYSYGGRGKSWYSSINWPSIGKLSEELYTAVKSSTKLELRKVEPFPGNLDSDLTSGRYPDILWLYKKDVLGHFVVATGKTGSTYAINDPEWNYLTLDKFNPAITNVFRFVPSQTDLSYITAVVNPNTEILFEDGNGNKTGKYTHNGTTKQFNNIPDSTYSFQPPISNVDDHDNVISLGTGVNELLIPKPAEGNYKITLSSNSNADYTLNISDYNENGDSLTTKIEGAVSLNSDDNFEISHPQISPTVTFESMLTDLNELYEHQDIKNKGIFTALSAEVRVSQFISKLSIVASKNILNAIIKELNVFRGKQITETAYQILIYDANYLKDLDSNPEPTSAPSGI